MRKKTLLAALLGGLIGTTGGAGGMLVAYPFLFPLPIVDEPLPLPTKGPAQPSSPQASSMAGTTTIMPMTQAASIAASQVVAPQRLGGFRFDEDAPGRDPIHWANGTGGIYRNADRLLLRLDRSFETGPGPNFVIYLNTVPVGEESAFNADKSRLRIGSLRAFRGAQNYALPSGVDLSRYQTVTLWCETFGVYIGSATLPRIA